MSAYVMKLERRIAELEAALRPLVPFAELADRAGYDDSGRVNPTGAEPLTWGDCRRARDLLDGAKP